jgi:23S rRNA (adenine-N6)-dimethyltransferase
MSASVRSRRAWGWHPLTDEWAARIVADAAVRPGELVLDIGAGHGALTAELVERGARVIAVELHPARVRHLHARFAGLPVTVVRADALSLRLPRRPFRVVASPPYAIASPLLRLLLAPSSQLTAADLVLQRARDAGGASGGCRRDARCRAAPSGRRPGSIPPSSSCAAADPRRAGEQEKFGRRVYQDGGGLLRLYRLRQLVLEPAR